MANPLGSPLSSRSHSPRAQGRKSRLATAKVTPSAREQPAGRMCESVAGADVVVVVVDDVDRGLFRGCRSAVDAGVMGDQVGLAVGMGSLIVGYQPARTGIGAVIKQQPVDILIRRVLVSGNVLGALVVDLRSDVRLLLGEQLVQRLAGLLLRRGRPEPHCRRPALRRDDASVQRVVARSPVQRVARVLYLVVLEVSGLV